MRVPCCAAVRQVQAAFAWQCKHNKNTNNTDRRSHDIGRDIMLCPYLPCILLMLCLDTFSCCCCCLRAALSPCRSLNIGSRGLRGLTGVSECEMWHENPIRPTRDTRRAERREAPREMMTSTSIWRMTTLNYFFFQSRFIIFITRS